MKVVVEPNYATHGETVNLAKSWGIVQNENMRGRRCDTLLHNAFYSLPSPQLREAALVAHHEEGRWLGVMHEIVQIERFSNDEARTVETVAGLEFGVFAVDNRELFVAEMLQLHTAVGSPGDGKKTIDGNVGGV